MKIEKLKKNNHKLVIGGLIIFCLIAVTITYMATRAKYQNTEIIPLVNGVVNYKAYDFKVMAMYQQKDGSDCTEDSCYNAVTTMPENGYTINEEKSYCTVDNKNHSNARLFTDELNNHVFSKISKSDKCYIWFDKAKSEAEKTLANLKINSSYIKTGTPTFNTIATGAETVANNGIYKTSDPMYGTDAESYYWRGAATSNYVKFGNFCWRIIRINGDGSIRMIYDGTSCHANGTKTTESIAKTEIYYATSDGQYNNSSYVGWTYTLSTPRTLSGTSSYAKQQLESWYTNESGFTSAQKEKIADGKFCNDRNVDAPPASWGWSSGSYATTWNATGTKFVYAGTKRLLETYQPTLACDTGDIYTLKVGLITADEVEFVGGKGENNTSYYLYNGQNYWTMSPSNWNSGYAQVFHVNLNGYLNINWVGLSYGLRPVINLKSDITISGGSGLYNDPYIVA